MKGSPGRFPTTVMLVGVVVAAAAVAVSCSGGTSSGTGASTALRSGASVTGPSGTPPPPCPTTPVPVVASVDQWGSIVGELAGACGAVTTIIAGSSGDPHDYEPTPADNATFGRAQLVVVNGLGYDTWASKAVQTVSPPPAVVDAGEVVGRSEGANPHLWYSPDDVRKVSDAVTARLKALSPSAAAYFDERAAVWRTALEPYEAEIAAVRSKAAGKTFGATEPVFDPMADAVGLTNATPDGYRAAAANESDPSPADVNAFQQALQQRAMSVLVFNAQTEGSIPDQIRSAANAAGVPVVEVTETLPPGQRSFVAWQVDQLRRLAEALG